MMFTAIPGQTGFLGARNLPTRQIVRRRAVVTPRQSAQVARVCMQNGEPSFIGGPREMTVLTWKQVADKYWRQKRNLRAKNAKQHSCVRPKRTTIRRSFQLI